MRNCVNFLIVSLLILSGCFNQTLESERKDNTPILQEVRINLGPVSSNRSNRYKGSYADVIEGGHVRLFYSLEGTSEKMVRMNYADSVWSANLSLSVGTYSFRAEAFNSSNILIFDTAAPKSYTITPQTTNLYLGLQLNPIRLDTGDTPMPVITQIIKPSSYNEGQSLKIQFNVKAGFSDQLDFQLTVSDDNGTVVAQNSYNHPNALEDDGITVVYNDTIGALIPFSTTGVLTVRFSVYSEILEAGAHAQFDLAGTQETYGESLIFMPVVEGYSFGAKEGDNQSLLYIFDVSGADNFTDNVSFQFDDPQLCCATVTQYPKEDSYIINGELYRDFLEPGKFKVTLTSSDNYSITYDFDVPGGPLTEFLTGDVNGSDWGSQNNRQLAFTIFSTDNTTFETVYNNSSNIMLYPDNGTTSYTLLSEGVSAINIQAVYGNNDYNSSFNFVVSDDLGNIVWERDANDGCCQSIYDLYLAAGSYTLEWTLDGGILPSGIQVWSFPVHLVEMGQDQVRIKPWGGFAGVVFESTIEPGQTETYDIYFNERAGRLAFVQNNSSDDVQFELTDESGETVLDSASRELIIGGESNGVPEGSYQVHIKNMTSSQWSGAVRVYGGYSLPWSISESSLAMVEDFTLRFQSWFNWEGEGESDNLSLVVDSSECSQGRELTIRYSDWNHSIVVRDSDGNQLGTSFGSDAVVLTPAECSQQFVIELTTLENRGGSIWLELSTRLPRIVVEGTYDWVYPDPQDWPVWEPSIWCEECGNSLEIWWTNQADNESFTVVNTNPDIQLGYWDGQINQEVWVDEATPARNLDYNNGRDWIRVRYIGPNIEETIYRTIRVEFTSTTGTPSYTSADITFEVRDND